MPALAPPTLPGRRISSDAHLALAALCVEIACVGLAVTLLTIYFYGVPLPVRASHCGGFGDPRVTALLSAAILHGFLERPPSASASSHGPSLATVRRFGITTPDDENARWGRPERIGALTNILTTFSKSSLQLDPAPGGAKKTPQIRRSQRPVCGMRFGREDNSAATGIKRFILPDSAKSKPLFKSAHSASSLLLPIAEAFVSGCRYSLARPPNSVLNCLMWQIWNNRETLPIFCFHSAG